MRKRQVKDDMNHMTEEPQKKKLRSTRAYNNK